MAHIELLDKQTIDKIAAGEVVERPASVVKELVENAIDAKATAVTVEIKEGGISFIRITDNGCGIEKDQIKVAFFRHSTSKIRQVEDLLTVSSLGFRGEALSSIAAVSQVELITKPQQQLVGVRYQIEGGNELAAEEIGSPDGTTFLVKNLFYNTPVRRKFLKAAQTEAGYVSDLMERLALSHPDVSFKFINNGQMRLHTSGNGQLKDIIYHIYGRDITANLLEVSEDFPDFSVRGFIAKPIVSRGNRNFENYFINGRYIKSQLVARTIEDAYKGFMMQHKYPFTVLHIDMKGELIDVNVHPGKMELRFSKPEELYQDLSKKIRDSLRQKELIPEVQVKEKKMNAAAEYQENSTDTKPMHKPTAPEPFETKRIQQEALAEIRKAIAKDSPYEKKFQDFPKMEPVKNPVPYPKPENELAAPIQETVRENPIYGNTEDVPAQTELSDYLGSDAKMLDRESAPYHKIIGQLFETYWLVEFNDQLFLIDQHAAHEKVLYEKLMRDYQKKDFTSQYISPPLILSLNLQEEELLKKYLPEFTGLGFQIEPFGGREYSVRAVPGNLYGLNGQELFIELIDALGNGAKEKDTPLMVAEKVASMSCKAAVKGNSKLSRQEIEKLIDDLLDLENPYFCPHGRPVIISMSKYEIEKKFKRII